MSAMPADRLLITVAPTGAETAKADCPQLPTTLDELVATAKECEAAGAAMIHVHIRDDEHRPTLDLGRLTDTVSALKESTDLVVQLSTGGSVHDPLETRLKVLDAEPDSCSLTMGTTNFGDGQWLGFAGQDLEATLDFGKPTKIARLELGFLRDVGVWVMLPAEVEFLVSDDGKTFRSVGLVKNDVDDRDSKPLVKDFSAKTGGSSARFVRVRAKNYGKLPAWHPGAGNPAWLFADELIVE